MIKKSKTAQIEARLLKMSENTKQGKISFADIAKALNVTPALVSQVKKRLETTGVKFVYDVNKHRGRPVTAKA